MPRYFFHTEGAESGQDDEGMELPSHQDARIEAVRLLGEMLKDNAHDFWATKNLRLVATNESGLILFALDISGLEAPAVTRERLQAV